MSKGALHRVAGVLGRELEGTGVVCVNLQPGFVATERMAIDMAEFGFDPSMGTPPKVIGDVVGWLASGDNAREFHGGMVPGPQLHAERIAGGP
jgi:NAD(P)-dependent dehydrogenase (short-subunit alcohol dehydrogenase family)